MHTKKPLVLILLLLTLLGCDPKENQSPDLLDEIESIDTTAPVPTITGLEIDLEVATPISVTIQESSGIEKITVLINQNEILNTREKTFSFELNPFDYPNGENTLSIIAEDTNGNTSENNLTFEVNKLLVAIAAPIYVETSQQVYFSVNTEDGGLVASEAVSRSGQVVKLYADDSFTPQPIIVTSYLLDQNSEHKASLNSIGGIQPGTDLVDFQVAAGRTTENNRDTRPNIRPFKISVTEIENGFIANSLFAVAHDHLAIAENVIEESNGFSAELNYNAKSSNIPNTLIYTSGDISNSRNNQIVPLDEYRYLFVENPKDSSVSFSGFKAPESFETIIIPSNSQQFSMRLSGYKNTNTFQNDEVFNFYEFRGENLNNTIEAPVIDKLTVVRNILNIRLVDGNVFEAHTLGFKDVPSIPNWNATRTGNTISMSGDYDKFNLTLVLDNNPNANPILNWSFTDKPKDSFTFLFDSIVFPEEFLEFASMNDIGLSDITANSRFFMQQFGSSKPVEYYDFIFQPFVLTQLEDIFMLETQL